MGLSGMHSHVLREMSDVLNHSQSSLKSHGSQKRCPRTGRKEMSPQSSKRTKRMTEEIIGQSDSSLSLDR